MLVIDGSYSMAYKPADKSRFERAKELAARIVEESPQGDGFTLVLDGRAAAGGGGHAGLRAPASCCDEIDSLELSHTGGRPARPPWPRVEQLLERAGRESPALARATRSTSSPTCSGSPGRRSLAERGLAEFRRAEPRSWPSRPSLVVIDLGQPTAENLAVTGLRGGRAGGHAGRRRRLRGRARRTSAASARNRQAVELLVDGRRVAQQTLDVPAGGEASVAFSYRFETPGDHVVEVRAEGDALEVDNHRCLVVPVRQSIRVLCVNGRPSGEPFRGAADYLASALAPQAGAGEPRPGPADVVAGKRAVGARPGRATTACSSATWPSSPPSEARVLDAYCSRGGNLVFFLGDGCWPTATTASWAAAAGAPRILPARLGAVVDRAAVPASIRWATAIRSSRRSAGNEQAGLLTTPVAKHFKLELPQDSKAQVVLALGNGDPLIVEEPIRPRPGGAGGHLGRRLLDRPCRLAQLRAAGAGDVGLLPGRADPAAEPGSGAGPGRGRGQPATPLRR